jgi:hypothetical protein
MAEYLPLFEGKRVTIPVTGTVTGGQLVTWAGATAGAGATTAAGVASFDAVAGDNLTICFGGVQRLTASANLAIGALVKPAANGQVAPYVVGTDSVDQIIGRATAAVTSGALAPIRFLI